MRSEDDEKEIEASKAPLMSHLIELRSRLIKALAAFFIAAAVCFFFAKTIYNVLVWPFVWVAGPENSKFIYTALLEYFITQLKLSLFGAAFISFPVVASQIYMVLPLGPHSGAQELLKITKTGETLSRENLIAVRFVPLLPGQAREL